MTGAMSRRLPRPVVWLLWLLAALLGSVVLGFLAGLTRPRGPDPWSGTAPAESGPVPEPGDKAPGDKASSDKASSVPVAEA